jgi:hypothetical protein
MTVKAQTLVATVTMSKEDPSSIESDYVFIEKPCSDKLQDDEDFVMIEKKAERPEVDQGPHKFEVLPHSWSIPLSTDGSYIRLRPESSSKVCTLPTKIQNCPKPQENSPAMKEVNAMLAPQYKSLAEARHLKRMYDDAQIPFANDALSLQRRA